MPKLLKNSMAWRQIYQKIQSPDIFYSISQENNLKNCGTSSHGGELFTALFPGFSADFPPQWPRQWYHAKCNGLAGLDFLSLWFFTCSTTCGFILVWGRVNCNQIVVRFVWVTVANFRIGETLRHRLRLAQLEWHFLREGLQSVLGPC